MRLSELLGRNGRASEVEIAGLAADSRKVAPGYLFAALPGSREKGADYIADAVKKGAVAVLAPPGAAVPDPSIYLLPDDNPRRRFALLAARFFSGQPATTVAVTGTNGKSSVVDFTRQIWQRQGRKAASLGTLGVNAPGFIVGPGLTTPDTVTLHEELKRLSDAGITHLAMEASSHGLSQYRLDGVRVKAAAFTNLTHEHLDYHGSEENYFYAKLRLFGELLRPGDTAVLNADSPRFSDVEMLCWARGIRVLSIGRRGRSLHIVDIRPEGSRQHVTLEVFGRRIEIAFPLAGEFQVANALIAAGLAIAVGEDVDAVLDALQYLEGVPGRLQLAGRTRDGASIYIDYAHTPDALSTVLTALRPHVTGRLSVIFGCGGDRDAKKRPVMGDIAVRMADTVIVTDDNPRYEDPVAIRAQILAAADGALEIGDRREAIRTGIAQLAPGDVLVLAGKGHEKGQIIGDAVVPFDDFNEVREALSDLGRL